jgi:hypothetical protein
VVEGRTLMIVDRHVSDDDYLSFYGSLSEVLQMVMDLVYLTRFNVASVLALQGKDVQRLGISLRRIRSTIPARVPATRELGYVMNRCVRTNPIYGDIQSAHIIRLEDGNPMTNSEFNLLWKRYMRRWVADDGGRSAFSIRDIRMKGIADRRTGDLVTRRRGH